MSVPQPARLIRASDAIPFKSGGIEMLPAISLELSMAEKFWFGRFRTAPEVSIPLHSHTYDVALHVLAGRAAFTVGENEERFELEPGDFFHLPRGAIHTEETLGEEPAEFSFAHVGGTETVFVDMKPERLPD